MCTSSTRRTSSSARWSTSSSKTDAPGRWPSRCTARVEEPCLATPGETSTTTDGLSGERLALLGPVDLTFADSRSDPRVQVADLLAGVARRLAWEVLEDRGNAALIALLRPYVDPHSIWADDRSWSLLTR